MISDDTATPEQLAQHLERLTRLNQRAEYADDRVTAEWTARAIVRCQDLLYRLQAS